MSPTTSAFPTAIFGEIPPRDNREMALKTISRLAVVQRHGNHLIALRNRLKKELRTQHQSPNDLSRETSHRANLRKVHKLSRETSQKRTINKINLQCLNLSGKSF
jgi:hypothetical protein